jgi:hypothetical protein
VSDSIRVTYAYLEARSGAGLGIPWTLSAQDQTRRLRGVLQVSAGIRSGGLVWHTASHSHKDEPERQVSLQVESRRRREKLLLCRPCVFGLVTVKKVLRYQASQHHRAAIATSPSLSPLATSFMHTRSLQGPPQLKSTWRPMS